ALSDKIQFAFIPMLEVLPNYQSNGIDSQLMERILTKLEHIDCIDLTCDPDKQAFYERFKMLKSNGMVIRRYIDRYQCDCGITMVFQDDHDLEEEKKILVIVDTLRYSNAVMSKLSAHTNIR
ncbi:MAG: hypothetical protein KAX33_09905, partial [Candidatus Lokiarchaeota archaeon]|nr:hypothetical protein [Candidatus Lokiarchaeota archaeon]